jgi:DNA-binding PadR family transcriptional regulator
MAATETRLLLLGAVLLFEPVNGYQVRRELMSWGVDQWAHINPGSIYSGFTTLTKQGYLERHDLAEKDHVVAVYTSTASGREEFDRLAKVSLETVDPLSPLPFHTVLSLMPLLAREQVKAHLQARLENLDKRRVMDESASVDPQAMPPHLPLLIGFWMRNAEVEREFVVSVLDRIAGGDLAFAGEPTAWAPPRDDPGWQMESDRRRYRSALGFD